MLRPPRLRATSILGLGFLAGLLGGWMFAPGAALQHDAGEYRFRYPARFELIYDSFDLATPDSRIVALRSADGAVLMVHSFAPASYLSTQEFADQIARQRRTALHELGVRGGEIQHQVHERVHSAGALREAVRQDFEIESGGLHFAQLARYVRVESDEHELFLSLQTPALHAERAERAFAQVLDTLELAPARGAALQRVRLDP